MLSGYLNISTGFTPDEHGGVSSSSGAACVADYSDSGAVDPLEHLKEWKSLEPGGQLEIKGSAARTIEAKKKGSYSITVSYVPPPLPEEYRKALREAGISYPTQSVLSNSVSFVRDQD